jgi:hypothetical protein
MRHNLAFWVQGLDYGLAIQIVVKSELLDFVLAYFLPGIQKMMGYFKVADDFGICVRMKVIW